MEEKRENAVKAILVSSDKKILILKQIVDEKTFYSLPGGRVKKNEDPILELRREVFEETHLAIRNEEFVGEWSFQRKNGTLTVCHTYIVKQFTGQLHTDNRESYEVIQPLWMDPRVFLREYAQNDELRDLIHSVLRRHLI